MHRGRLLSSAKKFSSWKAKDLKKVIKERVKWKHKKKCSRADYVNRTCKVVIKSMHDIIITDTCMHKKAIGSYSFFIKETE